jgi:transposase
MRRQGLFSIGIDLSKESFRVALARDGVDVRRWQDLPSLHIPSSPDSKKGIGVLRQWIRQECPGGECERIVVESTGQMSRRFAKELRGKGLPEVTILNPRRSKAFGVSLGIRDKTDEVDASILALYAVVHRPKPTAHRSPKEEKLRELNRLRESYISELTAWKNRLKETIDPQARQEIEHTIEYLKAQIKHLDEMISKTVEQDKRLSFQIRCLKKIKGIGPISAITLTAELGDLTQYKRSEITAVAGLFPKRFESGTSVKRRPRLVKGGGGRLRRVLYMGATSLFKSKGSMKDLIDNFGTQGMTDNCIIGIIMRKLLLVARAVMKNNGKYDENKIGVGRC